MSDATEATGRNSLGRSGTPALAGFRLFLGLLQGAALWWLYRAGSSIAGLCSLIDESRCPQPIWPATVPELFGPLAMILVMVPVLLLAGSGRMRWRTLALWALGATAFLALLGWHGVASQSPGEYSTASRAPFLPWPMPLFAAAALFIGHHLILPADLERKWIAAFPIYFDTAWKAGVQLVLSIGFTGAFWILLHLGSALFRIIGLEFLRELISHTWFSIPVTTVMFAIAVHLTDVRDSLIRGVRSVALMLLSWLLLLMTLLAAGFLVALPFTGLDGLWDTGSATALVLSAAAALIILINTAYQDGREDNLPPRILQWTVRLASILLTPLVVLAFWGLTLRIAQHGLTPDRIIALACALIGAAYAIGYGFAAIQPFWRKGANWMRPLERTNVLTAGLEIAVILALFSPIADPARLSVADQVARLERGAVAPDQFDYRFLRFHSGKAGEAALARLSRSGDPVIASLAKEQLATPDVHALEESLREPKSSGPVTIEVAPTGATLPSSFVQQQARMAHLFSDCKPSTACTARLFNLDGEGADEVLVATSGAIAVFKLEADGRWIQWAEYDVASCAPDNRDIRAALAAGRFRTARPVFPDIVVGDLRLRRQEGEPECPVGGDEEPPAP